MAFVFRRIISITPQRNKAIRSKYMQFSSLSVVRLSAPNEDAQKKEQTKPKLIISDACLKRLNEICQDGTFLRVTVEGGGCSGFQYKFDLDKQMKDDDQIFGEDNAKVVIDNISLDYCTGATVDYHTELIRSGFRIQANPQAEQGCSCGASFSIKLD